MTGLLSGTKVGEFEEKDLFECLGKEQDIVTFFEGGDDTLKEGIENKNRDQITFALKAMTEQAMLMSRGVPNLHDSICHAIDQTKGNWDDFDTILEDFNSEDMDLHFEGEHGKELIFNKKDITKEADEALEEYKKDNWNGFGLHFGMALAGALHEKR